MLNGVIWWSLHKRWVVVLAGAIMIIYGLFTTASMPVDVFPDFAPIQVIVQTEAPGYAPEEVESQITLPLETTLSGTPNVKLVRSISTIGLSVITLIFQDGTNVLSARQLVSERMQGVREQLPPNALQPVLMPMSTAVGDILKVGLIADHTSLMELRTLSDWTIKRRLLSVPGVSNVVIYGGKVKQYQILVNPEALKQYDISFADVIEAARTSNGNAAGGFLRTPDEEYLIRGIGRVTNLQDLRQTVIKSRNGIPVYLGNVARIEIGPAFKIGDAIINGKSGVILSITKQPWANTLQTTYSVEKVLRDLKPSLPADVQLVDTFRQADFIEVAIRNMIEALVIGGILVFAVLFLFLQNWRTVLISLTAIPLSLLAAVVALHWQGATMNTMTLGGLAIAIGEVVDDAIIDVENVYRRLREAKASGLPVNTLQVVFDASREVRSSVVYATFIVALVFLPVFALGGLEGRIFAPLAFSYLVAIIASLVVALTITPAMCLMLLGRRDLLPDSEGFWVIRLKSAYERLLHLTLSKPLLTVLTSAVLLFVSLLPLFILGHQFLPEFDESNVIVAANSLPGTSLDITTKMGQVATQHLMQHKGVLAVGQRAGRAAGSDDYGSSNFSEFDIRLGGHDVQERKKMLEHTREDFKKIPGLVVNVGSYISHRMDHVLSGTNAAIAIKVFGSDLPTMHHLAQSLEKIVQNVPGTADVQIEPIVPVPQIAIKIDREAAARYGLRVDDLSRTIEAAFNGVSVSRVIEGQRSVDMFVWFQPRFRGDLQSIRSTLLDTPSGQKIPIASIAKAELGTSPNTVRHENGSRYVVIQANVSGRDLGGVIADIRKNIQSQVTLPTGYYIVFGGQFEAQEQATRQLILLSVVAMLGIFILLVVAFRSPSAAGLVMSNLPFALVGGIWAIVLSGGVLSIGSLIGFITLFGISTRNGIMLISHYNHLKAEGLPFDKLVRLGALDRLSPVLMTALTASLGVMPIALLGGPGRELEQPLAVVILGGMFSSTLLTLIVLPSLFKLFGDRAIRGWALERSETSLAESTR